MTSTSTTDRIEKDVFVRAPRARVWSALTDPAQFSAWFGVRVSQPFTPGARVRGAVTHPGYEHMTFDIRIEEVVAERRLSWRWHPHPIDTTRDYSNESPTLVVFELEDAPGGTRLKVVESGFDRLPDARRLEAFRRNEEGWTAQMVAIENYVAKN
jgi:uncharacterized protein YndB with AHSA1/START domain